MDKINRLHDLLNNSANLFPDNIAIISDESKVTYGQLNKESDSLSEFFLSQTITKGDRIGIYCQKSIDVVTCIFGILKSEAAYIPLDVTSPIQRNKIIVENCNLKILITEKQNIESFKDSFSVIWTYHNLVFLKNNAKEFIKSPDELAYILHTSGSTGIPKGVMYSHTGALAFVNWCLNEFDLSPTDRFSSHAPFHFDLSIFDIFVCIAKGATLILIDESTGKQPLLLTKKISDFQISVWYSTPTILNLICEYGKTEKYDLSHLKLILFAGEVYPIQQFLKLYQKFPDITYYNLYGPTETNVCFYYKINTINNIQQQIPIGKVCEHYTAKIYPEASKGELLISGTALMLGYWNEKELTNEKIVIDNSKINWYKTGDIVTIDSENQYQYTGRIDRMIKRNGYRIELDEIEQTLLLDNQIQSCAIISKLNSENSIKIIAYIVSSNESIKSFIYMKNFSIKILPLYMIPDDFIFIDSIPVTSSNKTDYQKLSAI